MDWTENKEPLSRKGHGHLLAQLERETSSQEGPS